MGNFFTVTVKPLIPASSQHLGAFASSLDLLFDWHAFDVPKGANRLIGITMLLRGVNGALQEKKMDFYFAKSNSDGTAPNSLGTLHAAADGTGYYNNLIAATHFETTGDYKDGLTFMSVASTGQGGGATMAPSLVLQGEPNSGVNVGYDKLYVAGITMGALNFSTDVLTTGVLDVSGLSTAVTGTLDNGSGATADALKKFAVGDVIHAEDDIILGEIESLTATTLTFRHDGKNGTPADFAAWQIQNGAGSAGDLANNDELYNINPITLILSFER